MFLIPIHVHGSLHLLLFNVVVDILNVVFLCNFQFYIRIDACQITISHADIVELASMESSRISHLFFLSGVTRLKLTIHLNTHVVMNFTESCHHQQIIQKFHST